MSRNSPDFPVKPDTAWRRTLAAADRAALRALARGWPLERVLTIICTAMERLIDGSACSVLLLDDDGKLRHGAAPHLPQAYNTAIDGLEIGPSVGSCGTAAYTGRQVVVEDIRESPLWADYRDIAETAGLRACWSTPIRDPERRTIGTFAIYFSDRRGPTRQHLRTAAHMAALAAVAIGRRRADDAVFEAKARAEAASATKTTFLAGMSHELRTPLNAVIGMAETLKAEVFGPLGPKQMEYAGDIAGAGSHLLELINDLLDLARIEAGEATLDEETVSVDDIVRPAISIVSARARKAGHVLHLMTPSRPVAVSCDSRKMRQVLINLLGNAVKFTPDGGRISLVVRLMPDRSLTFTVTDNGPGMRPEEIPEALKPFRRVESDPLVRRKEGTGLGLAIVASFVKLHDGELSIRSRPDDGTSVTVSLPNRRVVTGRID